MPAATVRHSTTGRCEFVKNALKICVLPPAYYKYWFLSYEYLIQQNTILPSKSQYMILYDQPN